MTHPIIHQPDPALDLVFERVVDIPKELVWAAWTTPEHVKKWFTPAPWKTVDCEIDLRPGGIFRTVMCSPEGQSFPNIGCYLEIIKNQRLVWTNVLAPGYRPANQQSASVAGFSFTAVISLGASGNRQTKYTALVMHGDPESRKKHADMGFHDGWGAAFDQLVELVKSFPEEVL
jgi:uncharacterized protein YndB with AHSA1/START domain